MDDAIVLDSSSLVAILRAESDAKVYTDAIERAAIRRLSAGTYLEASIVTASVADSTAVKRLEQLVEVAGIVVEPFTFEQALIAREAYRSYGRGSGHPARLNFGDCFAYALAKALDEPLLFKGDDFSHTDVRSAV